MDDNKFSHEDVLRELTAMVPKNYVARFTEIVEITDAFCDVHLNDEYKELCWEMAVAICQKDSPVLKGKSEGWGAGIVYSLGWVNFLTDPKQTPHMKSSEIAKGFGISTATMQAKSRIVRNGLDLTVCDPAWTLPSKQGANPLTWMIQIDGFVVDIRCASRDLQVAAYEKGLIPYIPADQPQDIPAEQLQDEESDDDSKCNPPDVPIGGLFPNG